MTPPSPLELYEAGTIGWPSLSIERAAFEAHVQAIPEPARPSTLAHAADLFLACACARGSQEALAAFEQRFAQVMARAVARIDRSPDFVEETVQTLRIKLFVRVPPKIATYGGRAKLSTWLTTFAARGALDRRPVRDERPVEQELLEGLEADASPELDYLRARYKHELEQAVVAALARLSPKARGLLKLHAVERMSIDRLALAYGVGRSTAARWLAAARQDLLDDTERELADRLGATSGEVRDLGRALRSRLEVSLLRLLGSPGE